MPMYRPATNRNPGNGIIQHAINSSPSELILKLALLVMQLSSNFDNPSNSIVPSTMYH